MQLLNLMDEIVQHVVHYHHNPSKKTRVLSVNISFTHMTLLTHLKIGRFGTTTRMKSTVGVRCIRPSTLTLFIVVLLEYVFFLFQ